MLAPFVGPLGGLPRFDLVKVEDFKPAFDTAMAQQRREIAAITANPAPASFGNTILALERSGRAFNRVSRFYGVWRGSLSTPAVRSLEREMQPLLAAFRDEQTQNHPLYLRIETVYGSKERLGAEQRRLVWSYRSNFVKRGAQLDGPAKRRVAELNQELAKLSTRFGQNLLADEDEHALQVTDASELAGMTSDAIEAARAEAARRGIAGAWVFPNTRSAIEPLLKRASQRSLRERAFAMWTQRGDNGDTHDNNAVVQRILALRDERSQLLGFESYAHWKLSDTMAGTPQRAMELMLQAWRPAIAAVARDVALMQKGVDAEHGGFAIQPWDYRYYAEKLRKASHDLDLDELTPYMQLDRVRQAMFWAARRLYGLRFVPVKGVPVFHPDVSVYAVLDRQGARVGLWYFDPYAREGKTSGAWMNSYRLQARLDGAVTPIVSNNSNFVRAAAGQPSTISWDDAVTMFHEFGHALHGLLSSVSYASLASPITLADFGEFPSQLNEHWLTAPGVLALLVNPAGQPLPPALVDKIKRARTFNKGFQETEYLASALVDMKLHLQGGGAIDPKAFEPATLAELGMPPQIVMRHRIPQFAHAFSSEGYAAGYYNYLWAAVLEHDAFEAFVEAGDLFDPVLARRLQTTILAVGNSVDPAQAFRNFRGRDPTVDAYLRAKGFAP